MEKDKILINADNLWIVFQLSNIQSNYVYQLLLLLS